MKTLRLGVAMAFISGGTLVSSMALAASGNGGGGSGGGGVVTESGANNLSFPVILSDNVTPAAFPMDGAWEFATIDPANLAACAQESNTTAPIPSNVLCYYGRQVSVVSETGAIEFTGNHKVWWLQKRTENFWKALSIGHDVSTPLVVSAVDVGDLLESSPSIQARQIRTEFNLLQHVSPTDPDLGQYVVKDWIAGVPSPCTVPGASNQSVGCFAALGMSGAVPGTEQSINEMQGTDFGGALTLLDPAKVRLTDPDVGGIQALVYSNCARLVIQKISGEPVWDKTKGQWSGLGVGGPLVNIATYTGAWNAEITSGGGIVYGYNWNAKTAPTGTYRLTFVLDGNDTEGPQCPTTLATRFGAGTVDNPGTQLVNKGEANQSRIVYAGDASLGDEGGLTYIDLTLSTKTGSGGNVSGSKPTKGGGKPTNKGSGKPAKIKYDD